VEGDPSNATAQLLAGWISSRCGCDVEVVKGVRTPGASGVDTVALDLDRDEEVQLQADRRGGAVITQPHRPESTVALPERELGDLLGEELRRLDRDEPYAEALEAATGVAGLAGRSPVREHVWFDPAEGPGSGNGAGPRKKKAATS
jgi:glucose-6-phosphate dehydrogenase assembly protein OpcA